MLKIVNAVIDVNDSRPPLMVDKIRDDAGGSFEGLTICLLGLTFKPNSNHLRESPALAIMSRLLGEGAKVRAFDPEAEQDAYENVKYCEDEYEAAEGADVLVLATEWNQFRSLDFDRLKGLLASPRIVDLRNIYEPEKMRKMGFEYTGVGR